MNYTALWQKLADVYDEGEAKAIARYVLEEKFGMNATDIFCDSGISEDSAVTDSVVERLMRKEPVQYVVGWEYFCGHKFSVGHGVLVPRPETEWLVERVITEWQDAKPKILDIGTGSGCIAVALAKAINDASMTAWDISEAALNIAKKNAAQNGANVTFVQQDALNPPADIATWNVIVSNPPYILNKEREAMDKNVLDFEPHTALFVPDDNPLLFYRAITRYARKALKPGGALYFEINPLCADEMIAIAHDEGFDYAENIEDCFGKQRFTIIR